jgi:hypothetical protein
MITFKVQEETNEMTIENIETAELAEIIASLVKQGLTFKCVPQPGYSGGVWKIVMLGGF